MSVNRKYSSLFELSNVYLFSKAKNFYSQFSICTFWISNKRNWNRCKIEGYNKYYLRTIFDFFYCIYINTFLYIFKLNSLKQCFFMNWFQQSTRKRKFSKYQETVFDRILFGFYQLFSFWKTVSSFTNVDYMAASIGKRLVILVSTIRSNKQVFSVYQYQHVHSESGCVQYARHVKTNFYKMSQECRRKRSIIGNTVRTY